MTATSADPRDSGDGPARAVVDQITAGWRSQAVYAAVALSLPDHVADGHTTSAELAARADADPDAVIRLMRLLTAIGVFGGDDRSGYLLTPVSQLLCRDVPGSMRDMCLIYGEEFRRAWGSLLHAVRTGDTAFENAFGHTLHAHLADAPGAGERFLRAMNAGSTFFRDVPEAFDFGAHSTVTDLAGGSGMLLSTILSAHPHLTGTLIDRTHMVPVAERHLGAQLPPDRWTVSTGDMFSAVPSGSDVYLLSRILQDWDDSGCIALLTNVRRAMTSESSRLLIVERVVQEGGVTLLPMLYDLHLMVMAGGRERTLTGYESVLDGAGLRLESRHELALETTLLVAAPD